MYSVSIPLGATINKGGAAITITIMVAYIRYRCRYSHKTSVIHNHAHSLLLIPLACSLFGISNDVAMQVVGVGFIIGVLQDSTETALSNSSTDILFTATADYANAVIIKIELFFFRRSLGPSFCKPITYYFYKALWKLHISVS